MQREVGAYDAETRLLQLLRDVAKGERVTITVRGRPVAELAPARGARAGGGEAVAAMLDFEPIKGVDDLLIEAWIGEGRR